MAPSWTQLMIVGAMNGISAPVISEQASFISIASSIEATSITGMLIDLKQIAMRMNIAAIEMIPVITKSRLVTEIRSLLSAPSPVI